MTGVSFRYDSDRVDGRTLCGIDGVVPAGTTTAIVGEPGVGKTTLGCLAARLCDVDQGAVLLDGHDIRERTLDRVSDGFGLVAQDIYLFPDTLAATLRLAAPDAFGADLDAALRAARLDRVVVSLPRGYDNVGGARGPRFSGGGRPRPEIGEMQAARDELARRRTIAHARLGGVRTG